MPDFSQLSYWEKETYINHTDYLIIGSGIVGLSTAIHLKQRYKNKKVTILERGYLPTGASSKNAGFSCIGSPSELLDDLKQSSERNVFETVQKRWNGLLYMRQLLGDAAIEYQSLGSHELFESNDPVYSTCIEKLAYLNRNLKGITGIDAVFSIDESHCDQAGFSGFTHAIAHAAEGQINTGKMVHSLVQFAQSIGVIILNGIEAITIDKQSLQTNQGKIKFQRLAICTNGFARTFLPTEDIEPARAQVVVTSPISNLKFEGIYHFDKGYYYFRNIGNRVLFGGGRNINFEEENTTKIETTHKITDQLNLLLTEKIIPNTPFAIEHKWAGIMGVGEVKSPIIKQVEEHVFCGVRLGGMGVAIGSLVGKELAELMTN